MKMKFVGVATETAEGDPEILETTPSPTAITDPTARSLSDCTLSVIMAHRIITQVVFSGARIIGRAVSESYRQAAASQKYAAASQNGGGGGSAFSSSNITMDEACQILNVGPGKMGTIELDVVTERFKRLFDLNDPKKGGSFYLQSKILRARERIEREVQGHQRVAERERELREGFKPKLTKED
ncbi:Pam16 domain containing protein [Pyrenophora tritici-repentis]|nr:Pam16 domain containing protein [Pyrenophora tritici-repentis]